MDWTKAGEFQEEPALQPEPRIAALTEPGIVRFLTSKSARRFA